ncbi:TetR/AcrR family transcriptional regulator [Paenibacillus abyssi]|uniref:TetR family transcriptional regulator n=1 Tax=Paenibacillus abyssi TaxID=1340531 RepID=A0A917LEV8_9BACL|nr:TetR/AcrR family transcriptional regulator [Paenibacillus abyssi]GGG16920.1 TetR family transcriptional regulator [Paenibacillus abyssi]
MVRESRYDLILDKAAELFYKEGIHATGIDKVVERSGVAKMTLYKYFPSKEQLVLAYLHRRDERWRSWFEQAADRLGGKPYDKLLAMFDALEEWFAGENFYGCAFINAAAEFGDASHPIRLASAEHKALVMAYVKRLVGEAGLQPEEDIAEQLCLLLEGAIVTAQVRKDTGAAQRAKRAAGALLSIYKKE